MTPADNALRNILDECPALDAWPERGHWQPIGDKSLPRLLVFANAALALQAFFASKSGMDGALDFIDRAPLNAWRAIREPRPGTIEFTLDDLHFRLYLSPGVEAPAALILAQVVRAEWKYTRRPRFRKCPKRGPRKSALEAITEKGNVP